MTNPNADLVAQHRVATTAEALEILLARHNDKFSPAERNEVKRAIEALTASAAMLRAAEIARANWTGSRNQSDYEQGWDAACEKLEQRFRLEAATASGYEVQAPADVVEVPVEPSDAMLRPFIDCPADELKLAWQAMLHIVNVQNKRAAKETGK